MGQYLAIEVSKRHRSSGTVGGIVIVLLTLGLIVLCFVRFFWVYKANRQYDALINAYIQETTELEMNDAERLKAQLLESGMFIKMHRWDKTSFVKNKELYDKMVQAYQERRRKIQDAVDSTIDSLINL
jgi:hypothetical protein